MSNAAESPDHDHDDPMPQPPEAPDINACCGSGCDPCIFDAHDLAMDSYRQALKAWQARQLARTTSTPASASDSSVV
jgi:hypothetical protein